MIFENYQLFYLTQFVYLNTVEMKIITKILNYCVIKTSEKTCLSVFK